MTRILSLFALGFVIASGSAALAGQLGDRGSGAERLNKDYYMSKRFYGRGHNESPGESGAGFGGQVQRPQDGHTIAVERQPSMVPTSGPLRGPR